MTTGLLALGAANVVDPKSGELIGYVYTIAHDQGQLQRWLLFCNPKNELEVKPPSALMANWSLQDWQAGVDELWRPNGYYVWAQANIYQYDETYDGVRWRELPIAKNLPQPSFPERMGANFQLDYMDGRLLDIRQNDYVGKAYVVRGLGQESSIEYWSLPANYQAAGNTPMTVSPGRTSVASLDGFLDVCRSVWAPGSSFVITGCLNYSGQAPPFAP